ncbi:hypothetical protein P376_4180 [Streptomyces sp. HCCB10043]|uniref:Predicted protein n=1 Tax=Streptomyces filamentosus NRRL 15998 TaxID=457431 RepID=D6AIE1_STRFL|nr:predicted protein [Streptomyces filamentosus NRRL 15998]ESU47843.1 hypothetical protein P376_4180 [Streptomyces sp. HCCB10043]EWS96044.1 hypothetical protein SSIG_06827 [Streptomyces filamentosus NRRL 11379]
MWGDCGRRSHGWLAEFWYGPMGRSRRTPVPIRPALPLAGRPGLGHRGHRRGDKQWRITPIGSPRS